MVTAIPLEELTYQHEPGWHTVGKPLAEPW